MSEAGGVHKWNGIINQERHWRLHRNFTMAIRYSLFFSSGRCSFTKEIEGIHIECTWFIHLRASSGLIQSVLN